MSVAEKYRFIQPLKVKKKMSEFKSFLLIISLNAIFWIIICTGIYLKVEPIN